MSAEADDLDGAQAGLYRRPLEEFVAARDQLARQLRAAGDRDAARQVAGLRRPSISAWAANQLAHAAPIPWPSCWTPARRCSGPSRPRWLANPTPPASCAPPMRTCGRRSPG
jgi:hypothetical protein